MPRPFRNSSSMPRGVSGIDDYFDEVDVEEVQETEDLLESLITDVYGENNEDNRDY